MVVAPAPEKRLLDIMFPVDGASLTLIAKPLPPPPAMSLLAMVLPVEVLLSLMPSKALLPSMILFPVISVELLLVIVIPLLVLAFDKLLLTVLLLELVRKIPLALLLVTTLPD